MWKDKSNLKIRSSNLTGVQFPCKIKIAHLFRTVYTGMGFEYVTVGSVADKEFPEIMEVQKSKEVVLWGRLKSSADWILLDKAKIVINECRKQEETQMLQESVLISSLENMISIHSML